MAQTIEDVNGRTLLQQFHELYKKQDAIETNVENVDAKVEQETVDRQTADEGLQKLIYQQATFLGNEVSGLRNDVNTNANKIEYNTTQISALKSGKQDKLTAGSNITIDENNVISASGGSAPSNMMTTNTNQTINAAKSFVTDDNLSKGFVVIGAVGTQDTTINLRENLNGGNLQLSYGKFTFEKGSTTYTQTLPEKDGTFAMMSDVNTKQEKIYRHAITFTANYQMGVSDTDPTNSINFALTIYNENSDVIDTITKLKDAMAGVLGNNNQSIYSVTGKLAPGSGRTYNVSVLGINKRLDCVFNVIKIVNGQLDVTEVSLDRGRIISYINRVEDSVSEL